MKMRHFSKPFYALVWVLFTFTGIQAQKGTNAAGGNGSGAGGSMSYSVGQVFYQKKSDVGGSANQGAQQPVFVQIPEIDLQISKVVDNPVPQLNDQVVFTVSVTNSDLSKTATNVQISDIINTSNFSVVSWLVEGNGELVGDWDYPGTGIWNAMDFPPQHTKTLTITCTVLATGDNTASLNAFDQTDPNLNNNVGYAAITVDGSSGGGSGGIESNGSMAEQLASRNYFRLKTNAYNSYQNPAELITFRKNGVENGLILPASKFKNGYSKMLDFIPEEGPLGTTPFVVTPEDLLHLTNAVEVFSVDYFMNDSRRLATIMAMTTNDGEVYDHTKMICDRLTGAVLQQIDIVQIKGRPFIRGMLVQPNGEVDYAISLVAYESHDTYSVDNQWLIENYQVPREADVLNFQVWSALPEESNNLVEELLNNMNADKTLTFLNQGELKIPKVYVSNGYYRNGNIFLNIENTTRSDEITISGDLSRTEGGARENYRLTLPLHPDNGLKELVQVPTGFVFDFGFSISNNRHPERDQLYFADGPWGKYTENGGGIIETYAILPHEEMEEDDEYILERDASISGKVKSYVSLFKSLIVGNKPVDLTAYNQIQFTASGSGIVEVIVACDHINSWSEQPRKIIQFGPEESDFTIHYSELIFNDPSRIFDGNDVVSVIFNALGDGYNYTDFNMNISKLKFSQGPPEMDNGVSYYIETNNYPNPFSDQTTIEFDLHQGGPVRIVLYNMLGQELELIADRYFNKGKNQVLFKTGNQNSGNYFYKIITEESMVMEKMTIVK